MTKLNLPSNNPQMLAGLMSIASAPATGWSADDLASLWRHQLSAPLLLDLAGVRADAHATVTAAGQSRKGLESFADLMNDPKPPMELLQLVKEFAKSRRTTADEAFPPEVATTLYFASIALALTRHAHRLTEMDNARLRTGFQWAKERPWLDLETCKLFEYGIRLLPA